MDTIYCTINIFNLIKDKYKDYIKPEIKSIAMIQSQDNIWLESIEVETLQGGLEKHTIRKESLDFIVDGPEDDPFFNPKDTIEKNVMKFIEDFSPYSIINITDLFHKAACEKIAKKYNRFGVDR